MDFQRVKCIFDLALKNHARQCPLARLGLLLFESAVLHLLRAMRILRHKRALGLWIDNGASGKLSIVCSLYYWIWQSPKCLTKGYKDNGFQRGSVFAILSSSIWASSFRNSVTHIVPMNLFIIPIRVLKIYLGFRCIVLCHHWSLAYYSRLLVEL